MDIDNDNYFDIEKKGPWFIIKKAFPQSKLTSFLVCPFHLLIFSIRFRINRVDIKPRRNTGIWTHVPLNVKQSLYRLSQNCLTSDNQPFFQTTSGFNSSAARLTTAPSIAARTRRSTRPARLSTATSLWTLTRASSSSATTSRTRRESSATGRREIRWCRTATSGLNSPVTFPSSSDTANLQVTFIIIFKHYSNIQKKFLFEQKYFVWTIDYFIISLKPDWDVYWNQKSI